MGLTRPKIWDLDTNIEYFMDPITVLHQGSTLANVDVGFLFNRANGLVPNVALYWNESTQSFVTAYSSSDGTTNSNISVTSYANVTVGNITASNIGAGNVNITGGFYLNGTPFSSSNYGNTQMLANLAASSNPITIGSNLTVSGNLTFNGNIYGNVGTATNALNVQINSPTTATLYPAMSTTATNGANSAIWTSSAFTWNGLTGVLYSQAFSSLTTTITSSSPSTSTTTGALQVTGGVGIGGNVYVGGNIYANTTGTTTTVANLITSSGVFWPNGSPYSSGSGSSNGSGPINLGTYVASSVVTTAPTLVDSVPISGNTGIRWTTTAVDNISANVRMSTIDVLANVSTVSFTEYGYLISNPSATVATFTSNIYNGTIALWAQGSTSSVTVTTRRDILGSGATLGYINVGPAGATGSINATTGNIVTTSGNAAVSTTTGALQVAGGAGIGGNLYVGGTINSVTTNISNSISFGPAAVSEISSTITNISTSPVSIDSFANTAIRSAKYLISVQDLISSASQVTELLLVQDGTNVNLIVYGISWTKSTERMTFLANINSGNVALWATGISTNNTVKFFRTAIPM